MVLQQMVINFTPEACHFLLQNTDVSYAFVVVEGFFPFESLDLEVAHDQSDEFRHKRVTLNLLFGDLDQSLDFLLVIFYVLLKQGLEDALFSRQ